MNQYAFRGERLDGKTLLLQIVNRLDQIQIQSGQFSEVPIRQDLPRFEL